MCIHTIRFLNRDLKIYNYILCRRNRECWDDKKVQHNHLSKKEKWNERERKKTDMKRWNSELWTFPAEVSLSWSVIFDFQKHVLKKRGLTPQRTWWNLGRWKGRYVVWGGKDLKWIQWRCRYRFTSQSHRRLVENTIEYFIKSHKENFINFVDMSELWFWGS